MGRFGASRRHGFRDLLPGVVVVCDGTKTAPACFEVWILAHFVETGRHFDHCDAVLNEVKKQWRTAFGQSFPQKKAQADYRKILDRTMKAIVNAQKHDEASDGSWTDVWQIVEG